MRTRVKFCGITRQQDLHTAIALGVDAVGVVFHANSKRSVSVEQASSLAESCPPFVMRVGLFLNEDADMIHSVLARVPLDLLQFHGTEPPEFCRSFGMPYIKSMPLSCINDAAAFERRYAAASGLLLDSNIAGQPGGTGKSFDWELIPRMRKPIILAGGLNPGNVTAAIRKIRPYAVDVSSGIESEPGCKDALKMHQFMEAVRQANED